MHHPTYRITHTTVFGIPVVQHWLGREIAQWVKMNEINLLVHTAKITSKTKRYIFHISPKTKTKQCMSYAIELKLNIV